MKALFGLLLLATATMACMFIVCLLAWLYKNILLIRSAEKNKNIILTDAQTVALKKEFMWINNEVVVTPIASYKEYKVFKCGQGHDHYVMFNNDKIVDITTYDSDFLADDENVVVFVNRTNSFYLKAKEA